MLTAAGAVISVGWGVLLFLQPIAGAVVMAWWLGAYAILFGITLVAFFGSNVDTVRVLFGTVLAINPSALMQIAFVSTATMVALAVFYRSIMLDAFDPVFLRMAGTRGMRALFTLLVLGSGQRLVTTFPRV